MTLQKKDDQTIDPGHIPTAGSVEFISGLNSRNDKALARLFDTYSRPLFFYCRSILGDEHTAKDIVQEVFVRFWQGAERFSSIREVRSFLYQSAKNKCLDILKHERVRQSHDLYAARELSESFLEQKYMEEEIINNLYLVIDELPLECARIFRMSLSGMSNPEIADNLSISINTVRAQKQKAMTALKKRFGGITDLILMIAAFNI